MCDDRKRNLKAARKVKEKSKIVRSEASHITLRPRNKKSVDPVAGRGVEAESDSYDRTAETKRRRLKRASTLLRSQDQTSKLKSPKLTKKPRDSDEQKVILKRSSSAKCKEIECSDKTLNKLNYTNSKKLSSKPKWVR